MPSSAKIRHLFKKYLENSATAAEVREFWQLLSKEENTSPLRQELRQLWMDVRADSSPAPLDADQLIKDIRERADAWEEVPPIDLKKRTLPGWRIAAAAAVLGLIFFAYHTMNRRQPSLGPETSRTEPSFIDTAKAETHQAVLILANGQTISLDSVGQGQVAIQGSSQVTKISNGLLSYGHQSSAAQHAAHTPDYNTLRTPRGKTYQLVLPDGSKVWLNASSSIRFPTAFTKKERQVEITGEAYFEVKAQPQDGQAKQTPVPFTVKVGTIRVRVLGTRFNIMAYKEAAKIKTTLLTGAVKVTAANGQQARLVPGEQARMNRKGDLEVVKNVNLQQTMAWKNHLFWFDDDTIETVMQQIARWYDVDIAIHGHISQHFTGSIPRNFSLPDVFKVLNKTGKIHYEIKGQKIIISP